MSSETRLGAALGLAGLCVASLVAEQQPGAVRGGPQPMVIDFREVAAPWRSIDDVVMGGLSSSEMVISGRIATFRGEVSLENNGGFASVRSEPGDYDLSGFDGLVLRVRSDGRRYQLRLRTTATFDGISYRAEFEPEARTWQEVAIAFATFEPVFRGRRLSDHPPLDPAGVKTFGLMIADGQEGPFRLEIEWIRGLRTDP